MPKINHYPGHMAKTKRLIKERIKQVDIVFELVDARAPFSTTNPALSSFISNTPKLILLNKADLADKKILEQFELRFHDLGMHTLAIDARKGVNVNKIQTIARHICQEKFLKEESRGMKPRALRALIVGIPNVGKSTLINRLVNKRATKVGDTPGITRHLQMIRINKDFELLDTPGILWPNLDDDTVALNLALLGTIKDSLIPKDDVAIHGIGILKSRYKQSFEKRYDLTVEQADTPVDLFDKIGKRRGAYTQGAGINYERVIDLFLYDVRHQAFGNIALETVDDTHVQL